MSGDHNMNQMHMTHEEWMKHDAYRNEMLRNQVKDVEEQEQYKSQIERQCMEMQCTINLLKGTVETLRNRLVPVMADTPMRSSIAEVYPVVSPLGLSINQHRQQVSSVIDDLVHIIESLEI